MSKKIIIIGAVIVVGLLGFMWLGRNIQTAGNSESSGTISLLTASEKSYDFGTISMKNGTVDHIFRITNTSDKDVEIKRVYTSCMCTVAYLESADGALGPFGMEGMGYLPPANETIRAGESKNVKVVFDPNAHGPTGVGAIDRLIYLTDASGGSLQFEVRAVVTP